MKSGIMSSEGNAVDGFVCGAFCVGTFVCHCGCFGASVQGCAGGRLGGDDGASLRSSITDCEGPPALSVAAGSTPTGNVRLTVSVLA